MLKTENPNKLAVVIDLSIKLLNLKFKDLEAKSGVGSQQIARFCKGERDLTSANFVRVLNALPEKARMVVYDSLEHGEYNQEQIALKLLKSDRLYIGKTAQPTNIYKASA